MELLVLFAILALLVLAPKRGGRAKHPVALLLGLGLLLWLLMAFGLGALWNALTAPRA
jgi:hypothetical protein